MAVLSTEALTLAEIATRLGPDKKVDSQIIEMRSQTNDWIKDAKWMVCNNGGSHKTTVRDTLPPVEWRMINKGVRPGKSLTHQMEVKTGMMSAMAQVDNALLELSDDRQALLLSEEKAQTEALDQELSRNFFYGSLAQNPATWDGLYTYYGKKSDLNVFDMGGTGDTNTSMVLATWGDMNMHMIYPKGTAAGLKRKFKADEQIEDSDGGKYLGCLTFYEWHSGLVIRDKRSCARIANIDVTALDTLVASGAETAASRKLMRQMIVVTNTVKKHKGNGRMVWYANDTIFNMLHIMAVEKMNVQLGIKEIDGEPVTTFLGVPIHLCDCLLNTEEAVS